MKVFLFFPLFYFLVGFDWRFYLGTDPAVVLSCVLEPTRCETTPGSLPLPLLDRGLWGSLSRFLLFADKLSRLAAVRAWR